MSEHKRLLTLVHRLPGDYSDYGGEVKRWENPGEAYPDCSAGCKFARWLKDHEQEQLSMDWCVCTNPKSHRCGLLTFEHQACQAFEGED